MKRRVFTLVITIVLILGNVGLMADTRAQDDGNDIDDLQATAEAQETEIAELEERVTTLETVVAQATPVTDEPSGGPDPGAGEVLYEADATGGFDEWTGSEDWLYRDGQLVNDGSAISQIVAPYELGSVRDYAVEAEIRLVRCTDSWDGSLDYDELDTPGGNAGFGLVARGEEQGAYWAGENCRSRLTGPDEPNAVGVWAAEFETGLWETLAEQEYTVDAEWHTYRLEVRGDAIRLFIDGEVLVETMDLRFVGGGQVGLWSSETQFNVRSFRVLAL